MVRMNIKYLPVVDKDMTVEPSSDARVSCEDEEPSGSRSRSRTRCQPSSVSQSQSLSASQSQIMKTGTESAILAALDSSPSPFLSPSFALSNSGSSQSSNGNLNPPKSQVSSHHDRSQRRRAFWLYSTSFLSAIIMVITVHECGHALMLKIYGYGGITIRINPFMGVTSTTSIVHPSHILGVVLGGPVLDLICATLVSKILVNTRLPGWLILKTYGVQAFVIEGIVIVGGLFFSETLTDFSFLQLYGWPDFVIALIGVGIISVGMWLTYRLWGEFGFTDQSSRGRLVLFNSVLLVYHGLSFTVSNALIPESEAMIRRFMGIIFIVQFVYLGIRIALAPLGFRYIQRGRHQKKFSEEGNLTENIKRSTVFVSGIIMCLITSASLVLLN